VTPEEQNKAARQDADRQKTTPEVERELKAERHKTPYDLERIRELEVVLLLRRSLSNTTIAPVTAVLRRVFDSVLTAMTITEARRRRNTLGAIVRTANSQIMESMEQSLMLMSDEVTAIHRDTYDAILTPAQKRAATHLPIDDQGNVMPAAEEPSDLEDETLSQADVYRHMEPMLAVPGIDILPNASEAILTTSPLVATRTATPQDELIPFRQRVAGSLLLVTPFITELLRTDPADLVAKLRDLLGIRTKLAPITEGTPLRFGQPDQSDIGDGGVGRRMQNNLRHEARRLYEHSLDHTRDNNDAFVGYTLHSMRAFNSDLLHIANDGMMFFKDNRPLADALWVDRIVPPYRKNCICFTVDMLLDAVGKLHNVRWMMTDNPEYEINPRQIGSVKFWFDRQRPGIQRRVIGDERYDAAIARNRVVTWESFTGDDGNWLSASQIATESKDVRLARVREVADMIQTTHRQQLRALRDGQGKWDQTNQTRAEYRRQMESMIRSAL